MSNYTIDELIARWNREELTAEQMIGLLLLLLQQIERRLRELRRAPGGEPAPAEQRR